jgi:hypothetical protein
VGPTRKAFTNVPQSTTDGPVVAATANKRVRVCGLVLSATLATNATLNSKGAGAGTPVSPLFALGANLPVTLPFNPAGWFDTNVGEGLSLTTSVGSAVGAEVVYQLVS